MNPSKHHRIIALAAGIGLSIAPACSRLTGLPEWKHVPSNHPRGATNPPRPILLVDPSGRCYKQWVGGMLAPTPETSDHVRVCEEGQCGTEIVCPEHAADMLKDWRAQ